MLIIVYRLKIGLTSLNTLAPPMQMPQRASVYLRPWTSRLRAHGEGKALTINVLRLTL